MLDIVSRYGVAGCITTESAELATELIEDTVAAHRVPPDQLSTHADRGSSIISNQVAKLLSFLGIKRSHSGPHVSNDLYSEARFKALKFKYCPSFPERLGSIADARTFRETFLNYYNHDHRHSEFGNHPPASVHDGTALELRAQPPTPAGISDRRSRGSVRAHTHDPARFRPSKPGQPRLPTTPWINEPLPVEEVMPKAS